MKNINQMTAIHLAKTIKCSINLTVHDNRFHFARERAKNGTRINLLYCLTFGWLLQFIKNHSTKSH